MDKFLDKVGIDKYKIFEIIIFCFMAFVTLSIGSLLMYLFGSSYFALNYKDNLLLNDMVSYFFLYLNLTIFCGIVFKMYNKKIFILGAIYFIFHLFIYFSLINKIPYINFFSPIIFTIIYFVYKILRYKKINYQFFINLILWFCISMIFQFVELKYRSVFYQVMDYTYVLNYVEKFAIYLNIFMLQFLIYLIMYMREVIFNVRLYSSWWCSGKSFNGSKFKSSNEITQEVDVDVLEFFKSMTIGQRIYASIVLCLVQILQVLFVVFLCYLGSGKSGVINLFLILIVFWRIRKIIGSDKSFHLDTFGHCTIFSAIVFFIATKIALQPYISTFFSVLIGISIAVLFCILKFYSDRYKKLENKVGDLVDKENKE